MVKNTNVINSRSFVAKASDIQGLTAAQIKSKLALDFTPTHYCYVNAPANQQMYITITNGIYGGTGGIIQYDFGIIPPSSWYSVAYQLS